MNPEDQPFTVVICTDYAAVNGGQARVAVDGALGLKRAGHRPIVFSGTAPADPALAEAGIETVCLAQPGFADDPSRLAGMARGLWNRAAAARLGALLAGLPRGRTVVHAHSWAKALSASIAPVIAASGVPALFTLHDYALFCPNGGFYDYRAEAICGRTGLSAACWATHCDSRGYGHKLWRNARLLAARRAGIASVFSDFIALSDFQRAVVAPLLPQGARLHALSNPVSVPDLGPKPDPAASRDLLYVGRLAPEKGVALFAEAARAAGLVPSYLGDGPAAPDLARRFPEARLLGWRSGTALRDAVRAARAVVVPSRWYEGQPLAVLEAKALGVPVVVADTCAGRDEVEDGVTGLLFNGGSAASLARALATLTDDAFVAALSRAAHRAYWAEPRTPARHVDGLAAICRGMLARAAAPRPSPTRRSPAGHAAAPHPRSP